MLTNSPPYASNDYFYLLHDHSETFSTSVKDNDSDMEGDSLSVSVVSGPSHAASYRLDSDGYLSYEPSAGFVGQDSISYQVSDGTDTSSATIYIDVFNEQPYASDDYFQLIHDHAESFWTSVMENDFDMDGDSLTLSVVSGPSHAASYTLDSSGNLTYEPAAGYVGQDSITYQISDGIDASSATIYIDVTNEAPEASDDYYTVTHVDFLSEYSPGVLGNDFDMDGDGMSVTLVSDTSNHEHFTLYANGAFFYDPLDTFIGTDSFMYAVSDGIDTVYATVEIDVMNNAPVNSSLSDVVVNMNSESTAIDLTSSFSDMEESSNDLTYSVVSNSNSSLFDSASVNGANELVLDYAADESGSTNITVRATDTGGLYTEATFNVFVNRPPVINNFTASTSSGMTTFTGTVADESPGNIMIEFDGELAGHSTTTDGSGNFSYTVRAIPSQSIVSARAIDELFAQSASTTLMVA